MRHFFLGDTLLDSAGITARSPSKKGIAYFCPYCGRIWGRVEISWVDWMVTNIPCGKCGETTDKWRNQICPGSFLKPLIWWDPLNGTTLPRQLDSLSEKLLRYEAERHAEWRLTK